MTGVDNIFIPPRGWVVAMVSSAPCGVVRVAVMISSIPCGVAVVDHGFIQIRWCGCGAGNGYKASLSCRSFGCQTYSNIIQGPRFRVQGDPKMRDFDGIISAISPPLWWG